MKNIKRNLVFLALCSLVLSSCVSSKKMLYFQEMEGIVPNEELANFEPDLQPGDMLSINVSALDAATAVPFNLYEASGNSSIPRPIPYLVNSDGEIKFPVVGTLKVTGFSTKELTQHLTSVLDEYLVQPIVNIRLLNFKVTVLGEVKAPGSYPVSNERITIVEALGLAGDLNIQGNRNSVILMREKDGKRSFVTIDLTNKKLFDSPYYYLAQNDVLYVEPNKTKINSSAVGSNAGIIISSISTLISLIAILTR